MNIRMYFVGVVCLFYIFFSIQTTTCDPTNAPDQTQQECRTNCSSYYDAIKEASKNCKESSQSYKSDFASVRNFSEYGILRFFASTLVKSVCTAKHWNLTKNDLFDFVKFKEFINSFGDYPGKEELLKKMDKYATDNALTILIPDKYNMITTVRYFLRAFIQACGQEQMMERSGPVYCPKLYSDFIAVRKAFCASPVPEKDDAETIDAVTQVKDVDRVRTPQDVANQKTYTETVCAFRALKLEKEGNRFDFDAYKNFVNNEAGSFNSKSKVLSIVDNLVQKAVGQDDENLFIPISMAITKQVGQACCSWDQESIA